MDSGNGYAERIGNVAPLVGDFFLLFVPEMMEALGIAVLAILYVWLLMSIGCETALARPLAMLQTTPGMQWYELLSAILAAMVAVLMGSLIGLFAWMMRDRMAWSERKKQIEIDTKRIDNIERALEQSVTMREHKELMDSIKDVAKSTHELFREMGRKVDRVDHVR